MRAQPHRKRTMRTIIALAMLAFGMSAASAASVGDCGTAYINGISAKTGMVLRAGDMVHAVKGSCRIVYAFRNAIEVPAGYYAIVQSEDQQFDAKSVPMDDGGLTLGAIVIGGTAAGFTTAIIASERPVSP
jgi:hypothetical protein